LVHVPEPSHTCPTALVPLHVLGPHDVPAFAVWLHAPDPLQVPSGPQGSAGSVAQASP